VLLVARFPTQQNPFPFGVFNLGPISQPLRICGSFRSPLRLNDALPAIDLDENTYISTYKSAIGSYEVRTGETARASLSQDRRLWNGNANYGTWMV
jgi:hypothetical protein